MNENELERFFFNLTQKELIEIINFVEEFVDKRVNNKYSIKKRILVEYLVSIFMDKINLKQIYNKLIRTDVSKYVYDKLVWNSEPIDSLDIVKKFKYEFTIKPSSRYYGKENIFLDNELSFVIRSVFYDSNKAKSDKLYMKDEIRKLLKLIYPLPKDYNLIATSSLDDTEFTYSNEDKVLDFIDIISDMMNNNLIEFGKTNEKPLAKTLNILKNSTGVNEFYSDKKLNSLAVDMLTRSFYYYGKSVKVFEAVEYKALKHFTLALFKDYFNFFISRIFFAHLKKVRYDNYYSSQKNLFNTLQIIIANMPKDKYVSFENISKFCKYRDLKVDIEQSYKTDEYYIDFEDSSGNTERIFAEDAYNMIVFEPVLKASLFYLGALGLMELKYDTPNSHISAFDSLKYVKFTELGKYVFGVNKKYNYVKKSKTTNKLKFDEYKPIISVDKSNVIAQTKIEAYTEKYDNGKYILSYSKIFRDCKTKKALDMKIDGFYKNIEPNPPKVFKDFFEEIKQNANMLKRDLKMITIELKNNQKLLNLFMTNKKLQELTIKAQGYRILILRTDMPKLTRIVKDNGFFIEF